MLNKVRNHNLHVLTSSQHICEYTQLHLKYANPRSQARSVKKFFSICNHKNFHYCFSTPVRCTLKLDRQLKGVSIPFLGTNSQVYSDILRQKPSATSDFCRVRLDAFGFNGAPKTLKTTASIPSLGTT